jgi:predicted nucleotidyltransferase
MHDAPGNRDTRDDNALVDQALAPPSRYPPRVASLSSVVRALDDAGARHVVVGGLAVVLHGYARLTASIDLVVDLSTGEAVKVVAALERLGMVPRAPVSAREFADPERRRAWIDEKGMRVFSMHDPRHPLVEVDLFVDPPIPFDALRSRASLVVIGGVGVPVAGLEDLIAMKRLAGRAKDLDDIAALTAIARRREDR